MLDVLNPQKIPVLATTDILVIGAGSAGCAAALAAAQSKKYRVMLVERYGFAGGTSTQMLDTFYGFFTPGDAPRKVVGGVPDQVVNRLKQTGDMFLRPNTYGAGTGVNYNPERLKLVWDQMILEAGINYWLHTHLVAVAEREEGFTVCIFWNKNGFHRVRARRVIDASGDADFCCHAGYDFELAGEAEPAQSMTTTFRMSNVDLERYEAAGGKKMLQEKMIGAVEQETHPLPRKKGSAHAMCQEKCIATVAVKVANLQAMNVSELTQAEIEGRRQTFIYERFFQQAVPGYERASVIGMSHHIGVRETRRVYGEERLTKEQCMAGFIPNDRILLCGAPIEDHRLGKDGEEETIWEYVPNAGVYGVSYGAIVPRRSDTAWVVGRCFSATHDAHASCRSMGQTMSMGQAAGIAAVLSLDADTNATGVAINDLQESLLKLGAVLEFPAHLADTSPDGWGKTVS